MQSKPGCVQVARRLEAESGGQLRAAIPDVVARAELDAALLAVGALPPRAAASKTGCKSGMMPVERCMHARAVAAESYLSACTAPHCMALHIVPSKECSSRTARPGSK